MSTNRLVEIFAGWRPVIAGRGGRIGGGVYCEIIKGASLFLKEMTVDVFQFGNATEIYWQEKKLNITLFRLCTIHSKYRK